jgi:hypothetical protein
MGKSINVSYSEFFKGSACGCPRLMTPWYAGYPVYLTKQNLIYQEKIHFYEA